MPPRSCSSLAGSILCYGRQRVPWILRRRAASPSNGGCHATSSVRRAASPFCLDFSRRQPASYSRTQERPSPGGGGRMPSPGGGGSGLPRLLPNDPSPLVHRALSFTEPHAATWDADRSTTSAADVYEVAGDDFSSNHWTPDYSQPRASSSQYFSNMMTQELDDGLELLNQQDATPSTARPRELPNSFCQDSPTSG